MDIRVSGHQIDTGEALRQQVDERLSAIADKYFSRAISAQVTFGKGPYDHSFTCDIVAHVPQGVVLKGSAGAAARAQPPSSRPPTGSRSSCAATSAGSRTATPRPPMPRRERSRPAIPCSRRRPRTRSRPTIRRSSPRRGSTFPTPSVSDAVMLLDLRNTNALMFRNSGDRRVQHGLPTRRRHDRLGRARSATGR